MWEDLFRMAHEIREDIVDVSGSLQNVAEDNVDVNGKIRCIKAISAEACKSL